MRLLIDEIYYNIQLDDLNEWNHGIQTPKQQQNKMAGKFAFEITLYVFIVQIKEIYGKFVLSLFFSIGNHTQ